MNKILTIIVPSYNMEKYLSKGLKSVLQINDPSVLDIIIVNDRRCLDARYIYRS